MRNRDQMKWAQDDLDVYADFIGHDSSRNSRVICQSVLGKVAGFL